MENRRFSQAINYHYDLSLADGQRPLLICLHGYGQNKEMSMRFGRSIRQDWHIAAPQAPHPHHIFKKDGIGVGFGWVSSFEPQDDLANNYSLINHIGDSLYQEGKTTGNRAFLFAFSQSVSMCFRYAAHHPERVAGIIAVAGAAPSDWGKEGTPKLHCPCLYIAPEDDEAYTSERMLGFREVLAHHCKDLTWQSFPGGHRVPSKAYPVMKAWLDQQQ